MYNRIESTIHEAISNQPLVSCARIAELVKEPPVIPHYEAFTFSLLARYFNLTEHRLRNAYNSNRWLFDTDCTLVSGAQMLHYVNDVKNLGVHQGYLCEFANGVVAQLAYSANTIFNYRALLNFATVLHGESETAQKIYDVIRDGSFRNKGYLSKKVPWFSELNYADDEPHNNPVVCPYLEAETHRKEKKPEQKRQENKKPEPRKPNTIEKSIYANARVVNQLDEHGRVIHTWKSMYDAASVLDINYSSVWNCCNGRSKTAGKGKYRFEYAK